ncbi:GTPase IMAP family member 2-like [Archocentrus centrarchus]|uniref:GTPase IMAP family member 2-like n=1 Tax=Archocentrus centrarchus TaxID=63155 RepID=UPI0011E9FFF4|nr:GTPase IMAP family member 2-like [Archocentrus centrarchus]
MASAEAVTEDRLPTKRWNSNEFLPPDMCELRVVLLGNSWSERSSVGNFLLEDTKFNTMKTTECCVRVTGQLRDKEIVLINTPDLVHPNISEDKLKEHVENCVSLSAPGPHVFLLVLQPEEFTEEQKLRLCRVLQLFSDRSFDHSVILISNPKEEGPDVMERFENHPPITDMIRLLGDRYSWKMKLDHSELLMHLCQILKANNGEHVRCDGFETEECALTKTSE